MCHRARWTLNPQGKHPIIHSGQSPGRGKTDTMTRFLCLETAEEGFQGGQKMASDLLELELEVVVSPHMGVGT